MLSKDLQDIIQRVDDGDHHAKRRRAIYSALFDVAKQLRHMRINSGMSTRKFADELETSHSTVLRWETPGYTGYTLAKLIEVAHVLGYRLVLNFIPKSGTSVVNSQWCVPVIDADAAKRAAQSAQAQISWNKYQQAKGVVNA